MQRTPVRVQRSIAKNRFECVPESVLSNAASTQAIASINLHRGSLYKGMHDVVILSSLFNVTCGCVGGTIIGIAIFGIIIICVAGTGSWVAGCMESGGLVLLDVLSLLVLLDVHVGVMSEAPATAQWSCQRI